MTHFFNDIPYDITGNYEVIGRLNMDRNLYAKDEFKLGDVLVLYNFETLDTEIKFCFRKNCCIENM